MRLTAVTVKVVIKTVMPTRHMAGAQQVNLTTLKPLIIVRERDDAALAGD